MTDTTNRVLWATLGVGLTAAGAAGIAAHTGRFGALDPDHPLLGDRILDLWRRHTTWGLVLVIAAGVLLALGGLWLLRAQLRRRAARPLHDLVLRGQRTGRVYSVLDVQVHRPPAGPGPHAPTEGLTAEQLPGRTTARSRALAHALQRDLATGRLVTAVSVALTGDAPEPEFWIRLDTAPGARITEVRAHVDASLERFRATTGLRPRRLDVTVRPSHATPARVA
ncbi:hypothetical protein AB0M43_00505 [Longispora sp. NPDC051575]|uniref:hypothetical protein n=1 Tax=Longispora sp. NPDC051575 TaxID=3154943 RepID=UPI003442D41B